MGRALQPYRCHGVDRALAHLEGRRARGKKLSAGARLAFLLVTNFERAFFSVPYLAKRLEVAESTARGYVAELELAGVVWRRPRLNVVGGCSSNEYEVLWGPEPHSPNRGTGARLRWGKRGDPNLSDGEEIKAAGEGPLVDREEPTCDETLDVAAALDESPNPGSRPSDSLPPTSDRAKARRPLQDGPPEFSTQRGPRLDLRGCRSPLLGPELEVALRQLPDGAAALRTLERRVKLGLPKEHAVAAVKRVLEYHATTGVDSAVKFAQLVLRDFQRDDDSAMERREAEIHDYVPEEQEVVPRRKPRPLPATQRYSPLPRCADSPFIAQYLQRVEQYLGDNDERQQSA